MKDAHKALRDELERELADRENKLRFWIRESRELLGRKGDGPRVYTFYQSMLEWALSEYARRRRCLRGGGETALEKQAAELLAQLRAK